MTRFNAAFWKWFKKSKVVDADGSPLVVYHASPHKFNFFRADNEGNHFGTYEQASNLKKVGHYKKMDIKPFYLSIQKPLRMIDQGVWHNFNGLHAQLARMDAITMAEADWIWDEYQKKEINGHAAIRFILEKKGYDGFVYENEQEGPGDSWIVWSPYQVKSADNDGTWDVDDADVRSNPSLESVAESILKRSR